MDHLNLIARSEHCRIVNFASQEVVVRHLNFSSIEADIVAMVEQFTRGYRVCQCMPV